MADKRRLIFHVSTSLATVGVVGAVAASGCGIGTTSNPVPENNANVSSNSENIISNPIPQDMGGGDGGGVDAGGDAGSEDAGSTDSGADASGG